jgi:hypothetical protein
VEEDLDGVRFGEAIALTRYERAPVEVSAGDVLEVTLYWEALHVPAERYKVFLHLVAPDGAIVAQRDSEPGGGLRPTTGWRPADGPVADRYGLIVPADAQAGDYALLVGLYHISGAPRVPLTIGEEAAGDVLHLADVALH